MHLLTKITLLFLLLSAVVFLLGGPVAYQVIKGEIDAEHRRFLRARLRQTADRIDKGESLQFYNENNLKVIPLPEAKEEEPLRYGDTLVWHPYLERMETHYKASGVMKIDGRYYYLETFDIIVEADDVSEAVTKSLSRIFLLLLLVVGTFGALVSARIFRPFNETLRRIRDFRIQDQQPIQLPKTNTTEFSRLNLFVWQMTEKSRRDYQALKEFSENASHEMQTPIAMAMAKLELLMETPQLTDYELNLAMGAQQAMRKLSRLGQALTLLAKIENQEFSQRGPTDLSKLMHRILHQFAELMELKQLKLQVDIQPQVQLGIDPALADILLANLVQNAIRHNFEGGQIAVKLDFRSLLISNTGPEPSLLPDKLFDRFRKGSGSGDSLGLGLAIVKRICESNQIEIAYTFAEGRHRIELKFPH